MFIILMIVYTAVDCRLAEHQVTSADEAQNPLLESLRRQLMENNYDYQSMEKADQRAKIDTLTESQQTSQEGRFHVVQKIAEGAGDDQAWRNYDSKEAINEGPRFESHEFKVHNKVVGLDALNLQNSKGVPHFRSGMWENPIESQKPSHEVSKTDLLYYVDENRLRRSQQPGDDSDRPPRHKEMDYEEMYPNDDEVTTPKVKYKLFKVRDRFPTRRNAPVRRFLKERGSEGVAFISLDAAPFPQFKLPRSRRQYMQDIGNKPQGTEAEDDELVLNALSHHEDI